MIDGQESDPEDREYKYDGYWISNIYIIHSLTFCFCYYIPPKQIDHIVPFS